ncbi:MAG: amino acid adenylation domain-containing protein [Proteobacteria bacterium]|nr:amino acid adenylation domain-containing protein [Pseudomonadota bacterium]
MNAATDGVAIIGMAGRFPGAASINAFWTNLIEGRESITRFAPDEISPLVPAEQRAHPRYVPARGVLADADRFDAAFFGISAREARLMDPQQRVFLELCWNALEHAGVDAHTFPGSIGVYAGTSNNTYRKLVESQPELVRAAGEFATMLANEKDYVATRVAHRLGLTGPALSIHTACSTSLVAVAQAWYALMSWQCDLALAGGINIVVPQESGYVPAEGAMESSDGHCRPFDAAASGTLFSSGGGVVTLKRLADALADGDPVWAVIRSVGVNNDGADKASFSAPSVRGQAAVIRQALATAGIDAGSIGYVEAHGTGTALGDPIEVEALTRAFRADTTQSQYCWLGSVKSNFGHLVAASGVTGLIKATLALAHGRIPPTLHYRAPNPQIDFAQSPFRVADRLIDWPRGEAPRRAGVSSFGVGGTNAHVVLEEAPLAPAPAPGRARVPLVLSARDADALQRRAEELSAALAAHDDAALPDIAYTLAMGRRAMNVRGAVAAHGVADARAQLAKLVAQSAYPQRRLVFLFPGQGSQHVGMARELLAEPVFAMAFARCCELASALLGRDLRALILADATDAANAELAQTHYTQPALFAIEYALAELWQSWGLAPAAMIGHSIGEYVAACRAGVFELADAIALVVARGAAMQAQAPGAMLAVRLDSAALQALLPAGIEIATYNAPQLTVVAGADTAIDAFAMRLTQTNIASTRLRVSHAFHSASMDGAAARFRDAFANIRLREPQQAFYSCVSGAPITAAQATSPDYWCRQLRQPVRFADAVRDAMRAGPTLFLEVGPAQALTGLVRSMLGEHDRAVASLGAAARPGDASEQLTRALGQAWCAGIALDWKAYYADAARQRVPLPGYPFRGERYWIESNALSAVADNAPGESPMQNIQPTAAVAPARATRLKAQLRELFGNLGDTRLDAAQDTSGFLDLGFDSLSLTQAALEVERRYGTPLKFRRLLEDLGSIERLAQWLDSTLPAQAEPATGASATTAPIAASTGQDALAQLIQSQMAMLEQQAQMLRNLSAGGPALAASAPELPPADLKERPFGASARITTRRSAEFTPAQRAWVEDFVRRYNARTAKSKAFSQTHRQRMADPRVVTGFHPLWKELVYPLVVDRSHGARVWDVDGNEYIDLLNGFGVNFLGYQPDFIRAAVAAQLERGIEIGPQHPLTAEVAELIAGMTGMPRVAFCNTGSEAVMGAMRIARTVTGRKTIVVFRDSYHGIFDEVIVRGSRQLRSIAAAPGILASAVENVLVLDYGSDEALRIIDQRKHELAAVLVEPVQSKHPDVQPRQFLHTLRGICDAGACALIFDEVITGFRIAPGGAQEFYGVRADIATYGKIIGGGMPFAAIAGNGKWMDALDGGDWRFGDASAPEAGVTYFAGTFVRHPLALAAAKAALMHVRDQGPALQRTLNARTAGMVKRLNTAFAARRAPLTALCFGSLWKIRVDEDQAFASLLYYALRERGLHVYEQFNCFLSVAHGDAEADEIARRVDAAVAELMQVGLLSPRTSAAATPAAAALPEQLPLTDAQQEKWLACQFGDQANIAYNESFVLQLDGDLDRAAFARAFAQVTARHEAFALSFAADGGQQRAGPLQPLPLSEKDLAGADAATLSACCANVVGRAFDLIRAPLARAELLRLGAQRHALLFVAHHLIFDGWSAAILLDELAQAYAACATGRSVELAPAESFRAYALAERARRAMPAAASQIEYWKRLYAQPPAPLNLPTDRAAADTDFAATTLRHDFPPDLVAALRQTARRDGVTLYALLLTAFGAWLARLTGQSDFAVGIPFAGQALAGSSHLLGDGVNTLPLRLRIDADADFATLARATHSALLDAAEHQDLTLQTLLRELNLPRGRMRRPLASVIFNLNPRVPKFALPGLHHELRDCAKQALTWDLFFNLNDGGDALTLDLHYRSAPFAQDTVRRWIAQYQDRLYAIADMQRTASTVASTTGQSTVIERFAAQAARTPERIAVECDGATLSYAALAQRARAVAYTLAARGVGRGDLVGICVPRSTDMLAGVLGILMSGAAYLPLDPEFPDARLDYMADHARLRHLLVGDAGDAPAVLTRDREILALRNLDTASVPERTLPTVAGEDLAYVIYTSGSTGQPKGVRVLHRNLDNFLASMQREPALAQTDVLCAVTTLSFDIAGLELLLPLSVGARVVIATDDQRRDPQALLALLQTCGASVLQTTPSLLRALLDAPGSERLPRLKLLVGGEALPRELAEAALSRCRELWNMYGPTETTIWSTLAGVEAGSGAVPLGHPIANTTIHVLDEQRQPVAEGAIGEIWIGGAGVADGYLHRPDLTAERFVPDPFAGAGARLYRTGDLGSRHDGALHFHGRADDQVKLRGHRIELGDIEAAALTEPGVREAAAAVHTFGATDARLVLYVVAREADAALGERLRARLRKALPAYMLPQHIEWLASLPQTANGKLDRKALPAPAGLKPVAASAPVRAAPAFADAREEYLAGVWRELIGVDDVRGGDNFFELGGHSLLAVEMTLRVERETGVRINLLKIATGTLSTLAAELPRASGEAGAPVSIWQRMRRVFGKSRGH